ncbi:MAG: YbjN domain-containing protein [Acidimicrobiales bacterium]|nr:YbjN domain-containing protein [Acidimicrobiales bacterium]
MLCAAFGLEALSRSPDGDIPIPRGTSLTWVRVEDGEFPFLHLYAPLVVGVDRSPELYEAVNRVNLQVPMAKAMVVGDGATVILAADLPADARSESELLFAVDLLTRAADHFDTALQERFGGATSLDPTGGGDF